MRIFVRDWQAVVDPRAVIFAMGCLLSAFGLAAANPLRIMFDRLADPTGLMFMPCLALFLCDPLRVILDQSACLLDMQTFLSESGAKR